LKQRSNAEAANTNENILPSANDEGALTMSDSPDKKPEDEPEIVVDTDWKAQVEKEKQAAPEAGDDAKAESESETSSGRELPPASLPTLISMFYSQALMGLGVMPNPASGETSTDLEVAKHSIDLLEMLQEKTKGNTDDEESDMFDQVLHQLRMAYVGATKG
jgi:hypothetical protein